MYSYTGYPLDCINNDWDHDLPHSVKVYGGGSKGNRNVLLQLHITHITGNVSAVGLDPGG